MRVFDLFGREVATLVAEDIGIGGHEIIFDANKYSLHSGMYIYELSAGNSVMRKFMCVLK